jgi:hypothetical protein
MQATFLRSRQAADQNYRATLNRWTVRLLVKKRKDKRDLTSNSKVTKHKELRSPFCHVTNSRQ